MDDFNIDDYKIKDTEMTNADAIDHLERIIKFYEETHSNHFLLGIARGLLDSAQDRDKDAQASFVITDFIKTFGSPEMMDRLSNGEGEEKTEDTCDWIRTNDVYSMRDVPESAHSKFRAICEEEISKLKDVQD